MSVNRFAVISVLTLGFVALSSCKNGDTPVVELVVEADPACSPTRVGLGVGEVAVIEGSRPIELATPTGNEEFVLIMTGDPGIPPEQDQAYILVPVGGPRTTKYDFERPAHSDSDDGRPDGGPLPLTCWVDTKVCGHLFQEISTGKLEPYAGVATRYGDVRPTSTRSFYVLQCLDCSILDPDSYATITADLRYEGTHVLIYSDVNQPTESYTQADYDFLGAQFDNQIHPANTTAFGPETDIDGNGRVILLYSPAVDDLTPPGGAIMGFIAGFFLSTDLIPAMVPPGTSNGAELLYMMVPDPNGEYGNVFTKSLVMDVVPVTTAHEFEHQISFGFRFLTYGSSATQVTWLEEGMAHIAEDVNGFDSQNIARANLYLSDPGSTSLMGPDLIPMRGGMFLFLRYLGDRFGEEIYRDIVRSSCVGESCLESATGHAFPEILNDFLVTLYLSQRGITSDPKYNYTSFDLQSDFDPLFVMTHDLGEGTFRGTVRKVTGSYNHVNGFWLERTWLRVVGQTAVRTMIVRTQ